MSATLPRNTPPMFSRQWEAARDEAKDLDKYCANWDGADADAVPIELISTTLRLFRNLEKMAFPAPDLVYPLADGSVMIEWHDPSGAVQTANIRRGRMDVHTLNPDGSTSSTKVTQSPAASPGNAHALDGDAFEFNLAA